MLHIPKFESDHYIGNDPVHSPDPHCHSYFAATRNDAAEYPPLNGDTRTDVCVIGAGFTGLSAALLLAERGFSVTVLEQNRVGWGASGRCGGQMIGGVPGEDRLQAVAGPALADSLFDLGYLGHDIIARWVQQYRIDCDLNYGYIDVATKPRHLEKQKFWYDRLCAHGSEKEVRLVPRGELPELIGTDRYIGGMLNWRSGHLHPLNLCLGEARAAVGQGVMIHEGSAVLAIEQGVRPEVHTSGGKVLADHVLLAGNAYHLLEQTTFSSLLFPASTFIVATEPLSEAEMSAINPQNIAVCDQSLVMDYFRLSADRRLLFGGGCHYTGREPADLRQA
ncbi:MAG: FAD-binding oxidoreductase, partial [Proteobacteria bacterium]|nr:FAD-binding oxidoreductase [Pseudomonadota bacterium]